MRRRMLAAAVWLTVILLVLSLLGGVIHSCDDCGCTLCALRAMQKDALCALRIFLPAVLLLTASSLKLFSFPESRSPLTLVSMHERLSI